MAERREGEGRDGGGGGGEEEQEEGEGRRRRRAVCAPPLNFRAKEATTAKRVGVLSLCRSAVVLCHPSPNATTAFFACSSPPVWFAEERHCCLPVSDAVQSEPARMEAFIVLFFCLFTYGIYLYVRELQ